MTTGQPQHRPQTAFLDHAYAVVDRETAEAVEQSEWLRIFCVLEVRTTVADGETWRGRYLRGRRTYIELFAPGDVEGSGEAEGSTGIGLSPHDQGGLQIVADRLARGGVVPETHRRTRQEGDRQVPWFDAASLPGEPDALSIWVMEYVDGRGARRLREHPSAESGSDGGQAGPGRRAVADARRNKR
jgi:hypothetical protein